MARRQHGISIGLHWIRIWRCLADAGILGGGPSQGDGVVGAGIATQDRPPRCVAGRTGRRDVALSDDARSAWLLSGRLSCDCRRSRWLDEQGRDPVAVQKFGTFLSGMIMPNIAAFIAWGIITAFFIEDGWTPVPGIGGFGVDADGEEYTGLVGPMITYMLPLLIAGQGGRMVYGVRGGVVAIVATMGVIVSTDQPMFLGAMVMGPLAAAVMKYLDKLWDGKIKPGFEMLVNNFSAGIVSAGLAVLGYFAFGPIFDGASRALGSAVDWLIVHGLLPLASLIIEPAKVLF